MQDASRIDRNARGRIAHCERAQTGETPVPHWRWIRLAGAVAACAWACTSAPVLQGSETIVRLYSSAVVSADSVTLADVAEVRGESADLATRMELGGSPHVGQSGSVDLAHIQLVLGRRGVNLSNWVFRGASRCVVRRVGRSAPHPDSAGSNIHCISLNPTTRPAAGTEASRAATSQNSTAGAITVDPNTLEGVLREHLSRRLADLGGTPVVRFSPAAAKTLALAKPTYEFRVTERSDRLLGMVALEVAILEAGHFRQNVPVLVDVSLRKSVIVAARSINSGEIIKPDHLVIEERMFDRVEEIGATDPVALIGQRSKKFIENHSILYTRDIEPMPLILANDLVTVVARRGQLTIRGSAKALSSGALGETVKLRNEMSKEIFSAVVVAQKTAEVRDAVNSAAIRSDSAGTLVGALEAKR